MVKLTGQPPASHFLQLSQIKSAVIDKHENRRIPSGTGDLSTYPKCRPSGSRVRTLLGLLRKVQPLPIFTDYDPDTFLEALEPGESDVAILEAGLNPV